MQQIVSIQYLRGLAALMVVIFHYNMTIRGIYAPSLPSFNVGAWGVDIFFVISGFIMWTIATSRPAPPAQFLANRAARIIPMYWLLTLATALVSTTGGISIGLQVSPDRLIRSLFFIPQWQETGLHVSPVLTVGWTLIIEMFFYLLFAMALLAPKRWRFGVITGLVGLVGFSSMALADATHPAVNLFARSIFLEFNFGLALAYAWRRGWFDLFTGQSRYWLAAGFALITLALLQMPERFTGVRAFYFGAPAFTLCASALLLEPLLRGRTNGLFLFLGNASYSIYLSHFMMMAPISKAYPASLASAYPMTTLMIQIVLATAGGCAAYGLIEKPVQKRVRRFTGARPPPTREPR